MASFAELQREEMEAVYAKLAADIVESLEMVLNEPPISPAPVQLAAYPHLDTRWYARATSELTGLGFSALRDLDGTPLAARGAPPSCIRVLLSARGDTSAALYHVLPRSPGPFMKLLMRLMGKWTSARVCELWSYTAEGRVISTSNQGTSNSFSPAPTVSRRSVPLNSPVGAVVAAHAAHVAAAGGALRTFADFDELDAARRAQVAGHNAWRAQVGILPEELDRLLGPHGKHGEAIRPHVERLLHLRALRSGAGAGTGAASL